MEKIESVLAIVGGVATALPVLARGVLLVLKAIPGEAGEKQLEKVISILDKIGSFIVGIKK